jgi:ABC-type glycerol-3-phosphate transport system permease component
MMTSSRPTTISQPALPWYKRESSLKIVRTVLTLLVIIPLALLFLAPYIGMFSTALKTPKQIFTYPPQYLFAQFAQDYL